LVARHAGAAGNFPETAIENKAEDNIMLTTAFARKLSLQNSSRLPAISGAARISAAELACLLACGAMAALAVGLLHLSLRVPGHAILRGVLPMAMGLAFVPRRSAGIIMAIGAGVTGTVMSAGQIGNFPPTAMLSVLALGPVMDIALLGRANGWRLYARFIIAGVVANVLAYALKVVGVQLSIEMGGGGQFMIYGLPVILASYIFCGALAGFIGAAVWFRTRVEDDLRRN
jgi:hypothetical protein